MKYKIVKDNPYKLKIIEPQGLLEIILATIPNGMSIDTFVKYIKEGMKEKDFLHKHKVCKKTYYNYKNKIS